MKKRILSLILALCMMIGFLPASAAGENITINNGSGVAATAVMLEVGESTTLGVDGTSAAITWESDDETVATVTDGLVVAENSGIAVITATDENGLSATAKVIVGEVSAYKILEAVDVYETTGTDAYPLKDSIFADGYDASIDANVGSAPWMFADMDTTNFQLNASIPEYGLFAFTTEGEQKYVRLKIRVEEDGEYVSVVNHTEYASSAKTNVYLTPVETDSAELEHADYLLNEIALPEATVPYFDTSNASNAVFLKAGEYFLTFRQKAGRYLTLKSYNLVKIGEYDEEAASVSGVAFAANEVKIAVGEVLTLGANVMPSFAENKALTYTSDDENVVFVDPESGEAIGFSEGVATVTATSAVNPRISDSIVVRVGKSEFYYNYMKMADYGISVDNAGIFMDEYANDYDLMNSGSASDIGTTQSDAWKIGSVNSANWRWTDSATSLGAYFLPTTGEYNSMNIMVPIDGTYAISSVHSAWTAGGTLDYYIAPVGTENPIDDAYKINETAVNHNASVNGEVEVVLGEKELSYGEYIVAYKSDAPNVGFFLKGLRLTDTSEKIPVESVLLSQTGSILLSEDASVTVTATVAPSNASNRNLVWSSDNESVAVVEDGVITAISQGRANITASAIDGSGVSASVQVIVAQLAYHYDIRNTMATGYNTSDKLNVSAPKTKFGSSYASAIEFGTDPWMYDSSDMGGGSEYFDFTESSYNTPDFGVFGLAGGVGAWSRIKIQVAEDGEYFSALEVGDWGTFFNHFDVYIAPVEAEDPVAETYKVSTFVPKSASLTKTTLIGDAQEMPKGDYYVTFVSTVNQSSLIGIHNLKLYRTGDLEAAAVSLTMNTTDGAQIRTTGTQGLRFISSIDTASKDFGDVVEYGTVLLPTEDLENAADLKIGYENNNHKVAKVPAIKTFKIEGTVYTFTAVLIDIAEENYTRAYSARAYAIYRDSNGNLTTVYSDVVTSRSVYEIAQNGLLDPNVSASDKAVFQAIVDAVDQA